MIEIPLSAIPNQTFSIQLDNIFYDLAIYAANRIMAMDLNRGGTQILTGERLVPGYPVIPYRYLESGNFVFITNNEEYPDYRQFGINQILVYASAAELSSLRAGV